MDLNFIQIIVFIIALLVSISVHESMHSIVAYLLGDKGSHAEGRFSLNPLRHIDPITTVALPLILLLAGARPFGAAKPVKVTPWQLKGHEYGMALVAIAGPISNLMMAFLAGFLWKNLNLSSDIIETFLAYSVSINVGLGIFNLVPFPPLDGSRVLYAIAPDFLRGVLDQLESFGFGAIIFFMFVVYPFIDGVLASVEHFILNIVV